MTDHDDPRAVSLGPSDARRLEAVTDELNKWFAAVHATFITPTESIAMRLLQVADRFPPERAGVSLPPTDALDDAWQAIYSIKQECDGHRFGQQGYDITLDHIYEMADVTLAALNEAAAGVSLGPSADALENALRVAWPIVKRHGDEHEIVTVKDALVECQLHNTRDAIEYEMLSEPVAKRARELRAALGDTPEDSQ
ncbi:MAG TPA: hypothetical protein VLE97_07970 [Gaiellaceae bacterium]|nr:hypothetical protein [Gaiellaceae bacterium]